MKNAVPETVPRCLKFEPPEANASGQYVRNLARQHVIALGQVGDPDVANPPPSASRPPHRVRPRVSSTAVLPARSASVQCRRPEEECCRRHIRTTTASPTPR